MNFSTFKEMTRIEQTLFGLPFIVSSVLLSIKEDSLSAAFKDKGLTICWVFLAFFFARCAGMAFNQWIDWKIDAKNPRTQGRVLPTRRAKTWQVALVAWGSLFLFLIICAKINPLTFFLAPLAAFLIFIYSYVKRFSAGSHFVLGIIHFLGPIMVCVALNGKFSLPAFYLGLAALTLIAGNDMIYAVQDQAFDRKHQLHSIPAVFGQTVTLVIAKILHCLTIVCLFCVGWTASLYVPYYVGVTIAGILFIYYHRLFQFNLFNKKMDRVNQLALQCNLFLGMLTVSSMCVGVLWHVSL